VIASVIIGGASILRRGRVIGSCLVLCTVLINKVLRELAHDAGHQGRWRGYHGECNQPVACQVRCRAFLGVILVLAVLIEPFIIRRQVPAGCGRGSAARRHRRRLNPEALPLKGPDAGHNGE
jgi:ribose transport system permease protein